MVSGHNCQSGVDVLNFHKEADCNTLFSHSRMFDLDLVWSRSFPRFSSYKFLWVHLGTLSVKLPLSLPPALVPLLAPGPRLQASASAPIVRANSLSELWSIRPPRTQTSLTSVQGGPKSPGRFPIPLPLLSRSLPPPLRKMVGEAARRRPETRRMVAHLQVIRSSLSRAPAEW